MEKFEAIGKLAGGIAHDFNNVIGAIMGWAELGEEEVAEGSRAHKFFVQIREQSERAGRLTRQLLAYARRQVLTPRNINLNDIVGEAMALLQRVIGEQIEVKTLLASDLHTTKADPAQVEQVLLNLCFNARDAMPDGGRLVIETRNTDLDEAYCLGNGSVSPGRYVQLSVSDSGVGMDAATMERMFEPFFTTKDKSKGTGLGLATAFGIAKQHLGHIDVYSEVGKGSIFRVYLPATEDSAETRVAIEQAPVRGGTETILLAEDHEGLRQMSHEVLTGLGYSIVLARDGREAVEKFEANPQTVLVAGAGRRDAQVERPGRARTDSRNQSHDSGDFHFGVFGRIADAQFPGLPWRRATPSEALSAERFSQENSRYSRYLRSETGFCAELGKAPTARGAPANNQLFSPRRPYV